MTRWFKWYGPQWLLSTARDELTDYERGNWLDFCALASTETIGIPAGSFKIASWEALARMLNSPFDHIISTRDKCVATQRINVNDSPEGIVVKVINWQKYQTIASNNRPASSLPTQAPKSASRISMQSRVEERGGDPLSSLRSDNGQQPIGVAALKRASKPTKRRREPKLDPDTLQACKDIETWLEQQRGYVSPCFAAERKATAWMLAHGSTPAHIRDCYLHLQESERWLKGKLLRMTYVQQQIGAWRNGGSADPGPPP